MRVRRTLLITNDFPPRVGGIQSYVHELARRLPPDSLVVLASDHPGASSFDAAQDFPVVRYPTSMLLPTPGVAGRAEQLIDRHRLDAVWYGAAAPLGLLTTRLRRTGRIRRVVASTHGHEVGWSMLPVARQMLRRIGTTADVITYVSSYARRRISSALGPLAALEALPPGVDVEMFRPDPTIRSAVRTRYGLEDRLVITCVSRLVPRKGQDRLIDALPLILRAHPTAHLLLVGDGPYRDRLLRRASASPHRDAITFTGPVGHDDLPGHYLAGDVFAMPCRTRGGGLDVEGFGIVFLEASAAGLPVVAGTSGGAPETVIPGRTGTVVDGTDIAGVAAAIIDLFDDPGRRDRYGAEGRRRVVHSHTWDAAAARLEDLLSR